MRRIATVLLTAFSVATARSSLATPCGVEQVCSQPAQSNCQVTASVQVDHYKYEVIPALEAERPGLPGRIQSCEDQRSTLAEAYAQSNRALGEIQGRLQASQAARGKTAQVAATLEAHRGALDSLRPVIQEAVPQLLEDLRQYLTAQESGLEQRIEDLADQIHAMPDGDERRNLSLELDGLSDLRALRELAGGPDRVSALMDSAFDPSAGSDALGAFSPFSRSLLESARNLALSYRDGTQAFDSVTQAWTDATAQLNSELARLDLEIGADQAAVTLATANAATAQASLADKTRECQALQERRDGGLDRDIQAAQDEIAHWSGEWGRCDALYCHYESVPGCGGGGPR